MYSLYSFYYLFIKFIFKLNKKSVLIFDGDKFI